MANCEACGGPVSYGKCRECGAIAANAAPNVKPDPPRICPLDGTPLRADGYCTTGDGYPITIRQCPEVCVKCRRPLRWDGDCDACKPEGAKPGHLYDFEPVKAGVPTTGHWRIVERGLQPIVGPTPEQRAALTRLFGRYTGRV